MPLSIQGVCRHPVFGRLVERVGACRLKVQNIFPLSSTELANSSTAKYIAIRTQRSSVCFRVSYHKFVADCRIGFDTCGVGQQATELACSSTAKRAAIITHVLRSLFRPSCHEIDCRIGFDTRGVGQQNCEQRALTIVRKRYATTGLALGHLFRTKEVPRPKVVVREVFRDLRQERVREAGLGKDTTELRRNQ